MKHEEPHEVDVSRRKFLKLGGLLGLALGALSLPSLGWSESTPDASRETEQEPWQEARRRRRARRTSGRRRKASDLSTDWQEIG